MIKLRMNECLWQSLAVEVSRTEIAIIGGIIKDRPNEDIKEVSIYDTANGEFKKITPMDSGISQLSGKALFHKNLLYIFSSKHVN